MIDELMARGEAELFKGGVHLCVFGLATMCFGYSLMAWSQRRERHLLANALVYGGLTWYELRQLRRHLG